MVVCHKYKFVFIEVPHTGSHSITQELLDNFPCERILRKHANISQFFAQASKEEQAYFKFAAVRNPLDTAVTDFCKYEGNHKDQYTNPDALLSNGGHVTADHLAQFDFIYNQGQDFPSFMRQFRNKIYHNWFLLGADRMDFIIRFEDLQQDYRTALEKIGVEVPRDLPHVNPTKKKRKHYTEFYTPEIEQLIVQCYGPFMKRWGYDFPAGWQHNEVPLLNKLRFESLELGVGFVARHFSLDPDAKLVRSLKRVADKIA